MDENPYKSPESPSSAPPKSDEFPSERFVIVFCVSFGAAILCLFIGGIISGLHELFVPQK